MIKINNSSPDIITFNGEDVLEIIYNGNSVWKKLTSSETWLLPDQLPVEKPLETQSANFTADSIIFSSISYKAGILLLDEIQAYSNGKWVLNDYKTLKFNMAPLSTLRSWLVEIGATLQEA